MTLDKLEDDYEVILCDIWGCIHDGVKLYPGAAARLRRWRGKGKTIVLLTNAPRTAEAVADQLRQLGLDRSQWDSIATSGEAGIAALNAIGQPVGFIGTARDREILEGRGVQISGQDDFGALACTGLDERRRDVADYDDQLQGLAGRGVEMHCLNPDRVVVRGGVREPCAGAIADRYLALGGEVTWYGKPFQAIYRHAMRLAGDPETKSVLAIGDGLHTDILGAARMGFDTVYVTGGIGAGEAIPGNFYRDNGLGDWRPVAVVDSLH
jgi:HAD superfamily hydrolase (TIGR01459 family)